MKRQYMAGFLAILVFLAVSSCTTVGNVNTATPPEVRITLVNFLSSTGIGTTTEINFSVINQTDQELKDLTLTVETNPTYGVDVPFNEMTIDRIPARGSWAPDKPFLVTGRRPGETAVHFIVSRNGTVLAKDYVLVDVGPGQYYERP